MQKTIIALVLLVVVASLVMTGCTAPEQKDTQADTKANVTGAEESQITGDIQDVDNMDAELNDPELNNTDDYLDEVNW